MRLSLLLVLLVALAACAGPERTAARPAGAHPVILVSIDGFRWDYLDRPDVEAPTLRRLAAEGVRAERLVPVYPTKTFPNHYSLVTGLYPSQHGIVANTMRDPGMLDASGQPERFSLSNRDAVTDARWWGGEPIWVTAERQGVHAGTVFWPGSEAAIEGVRPSRWLVYDGSLPYAARVDTALAWLRLPAAVRPRLLTLYFEGVDTAGHRFGPDTPEVARAIEDVDDALGRLLDGLRRQGLLDQTDLVVVSDHGMTATSPDRVVVLDDAIDLSTVDVDWGEPVGLWPHPGVDVDSLVARLDALPHVRAFRKEDTPARLHYRDNRRIPPIVLLGDEGWTVTSRAFVERSPERLAGGAHGYDNADRSMHGVLLARGPDLRQGVRLGPVSTLDVYDLVARLLGVTPAPNEGDEATVDEMLR